MVEGVGLGFRVQGSGFRVHRIQGGFGVKKRFARHPADELSGLDSVYHGCPAKKKKKKADTFKL